MTVNINLLQSPEASHTVVVMYNIVTRIKIGKFSDCQAVTTSEEALYPELVIPVEDLVVSVDGDAEIMVGKTLVQVQQQRCESDCRIQLGEYFAQTLLLNLALGDNEILISLTGVEAEP